MAYIFSQVFVVLSYLALAVTYIVKNRKLILTVSFASLVFNSIAYFLLSAWSGLAMCGVAILRNVLLLIQNHFDKDKNNKVADWLIFAFLVVVFIVSAIFTYNGILSLFSVFATFVYTVSIWQKNEITYKILGLICSCFWIVYNIFIWSIFGFSLEILLLFVEMYGIIVYFKNKRIENKVGDENQEKENLE